MKNLTKILLFSLLFLLGTKAFAAGSEVPEYYFEGFGTEPFWSISIDSDEAYYSEAEFIHKAKKKEDDIQVGIYDYLVFTTTEDKIKFEGDYISGEIIKKECTDDSKGDTHEYTITVERDDFKVSGCADKKEKEKKLDILGTDSVWSGKMKGEYFYYSNPSMQKTGEMTYIVEKIYKLKFSEQDERHIQFKGENIVGEISKESCDVGGGETYPYKVYFGIGNSKSLGCGTGSIESLIIKEKENSDNTHGPINKEPRPVGGDRDSHGCMLGAGYHWYDIKQDCIKIFEVNLKEENYHKYLKALDKATSEEEKKIYDAIGKYKKIIAKLNKKAQKNINKKIIERLDEMLKKSNSVLLELLKFEIMQLD